MGLTLVEQRLKLHTHNITWYYILHGTVTGRTEAQTPHTQHNMILYILQCTPFITVVYIAELDISRSHVGPHFFAHLFREFCRRGTQERDIFSEIAVTPCMQFAGDNSRNLLTAITFVPVRRRQFFAKSTRAYLSIRPGAHAVRWAAMLGGALAPPLCHRVGSS